jgi:hypothetical protein
MDLSYEADTEQEFKITEYDELLDNLEHSKFLFTNLDLHNIDDELLENILQFLVLLNEKFTIYKDNICFDSRSEIYKLSSINLKDNLDLIKFKFSEFEDKILEIEHNGYLDFNLMIPVLHDLLILTIDIQQKLLEANNLCSNEMDEQDITNIFNKMEI